MVVVVVVGDTLLGVMQLGLGIPHTGKLASRDFVRDFSQAAEELGYGVLWAADHVVMPERIQSEYTLARKPARMQDNSVSRALSPNYESTSTLLFLSGLTSRIKLGTAVQVLPLRNPVLNARLLASLDIYSGGRLLYGVGVGWLKEEADAMQVPWDQRGARSEEHIAVLRRLWLAEGDLVDFEGRFYRFPNIDPQPRPVQKPPPILIGGHSDVALERTGRVGDGWIAASMSIGRLVEHWAKVRAAAEATGREPESLLLVNSNRVAVGDSADKPLAEPISDVIDRFTAFRDAGVDYLTVGLDAPSREVRMAAMRAIAEKVLPAVT